MTETHSNHRHTTRRTAQALAQHGPRGRQGPALGAKLDLTEAQQTQLQEVRQAHREQTQTWMAANPNATREDKQAYFATQQEAMKSALSSILTAEQQQKLQENDTRRAGRSDTRMQRDRAGKRGEQEARPDRMRRGDAGNGGNRMGRLELTPEQRTQLRENMTAQREAAKTWLAANPNATREERQAHRKAQAEAGQTALKGLLTPEQQQAWEEMKTQRLERSAQGRTNRAGSANRLDTSSQSTQTSETNEPAPVSAFGLSNYPNPFNPTTEIQFTLSEANHVSLAVYDLQGREVARLVDAQQGAGSHTATFDASGLPTGTYLYRLTVGATTVTGRMVLMK